MEETRKKRSIDFLNGSILDKMILFALPLAASSILQQLFNSADVAVAGQFAGDAALGAVGINAPVINLLVNLFVGMAVGANAVISRYIGEGDEAGIKRAVHTAVFLSVICGVFLVGLGQLVAHGILELLGTPSDIMSGAELYLRIYFGGMPFIMLYNYAAAIFRSVGDNKRPLIVLAVSGGVNVCLNLFFVIVCDMGVAGVAVATVVSNVISSVVLLILLSRRKDALKFEFKSLRIKKKELLSIIRIGVPAGLQGMMFSISNLCIQSAINALGAEYVEASTAALNLEFYMYFVINAFCQTAVTFIGQNYGAGNYKRCRKIARIALAAGAVATFTVGGIFILLRRYLLAIFTPNPELIEIAAVRVVIIIGFELLNMVIDVLSGCMRGFGKSIVPAVICVVGICGIRILYVYTLYTQMPSFTNLMWVYPISWAITVVGIVAAYLIQTHRTYKTPPSRVGDFDGTAATEPACEIVSSAEPVEPEAPVDRVADAPAKKSR